MTSGLKHQMTYFDLVRGLSAQLVVLGHASVLALPALFAARGRDGRLGARPDQFHVQSYGVVIFLVLSGYLITMSVQRRRRDPSYGFRAYLVDRWARIFTPLLPAMVAVVLIDRLVFSGSASSRFIVVRHDITTVLSNLLMLQDNSVLRQAAAATGAPLAARSLGSAAPWWTVALEWWIYVGFGLVALVLLHRPTTGRGLSALPALVFAAATVLGTVETGSGLMLSWLVGFAYAWWAPAMRAVPRSVHAGLTVLAVLWLWWCFDVVHLGVYAPTVCVLTGVAVVSGFHMLDWSRVLGPARGPVAFVSDYSYSLYLVHFSVMIWLVHLVEGRVTGIELYVLLVAAGNGAGVLWWWLFERHFGRVRDTLRRVVTRPSNPRPQRSPVP